MLSPMLALLPTRGYTATRPHTGHCGDGAHGSITICVSVQVATATVLPTTRTVPGSVPNPRPVMRHRYTFRITSSGRVPFQVLPISQLTTPLTTPRFGLSCETRTSVITAA